MKHFISFILIIIASTNFSYATPHGGGLNKDGCHHNRKTGGYHCHRKSYNPKPKATSTYGFSTSTQSFASVPKASQIQIMTIHILLKHMDYVTGDQPDSKMLQIAIQQFMLDRKILNLASYDQLILDLSLAVADNHKRKVG